MKVHIEDVLSNPFQVREVEDEESFNRLKMSISHFGLLQKPLARHHPSKPAKFQLIFGHRRVKALRELGVKEVDIELVEMADMDVAIASLAENLDRQDLTDFEIGRAFKMLRDEFHMTTVQIAAKYEISQPYVSRLINMVSLEETLMPRGIEQFEKKITEGHAREILRAPKEQHIPLAQEVVERNLTVRELRDEVQRLSDEDAKSKEEMDRIRRFETTRAMTLNESCPTCGGTHFTVKIMKCEGCDRRF